MWPGDQFILEVEKAAVIKITTLYTYFKLCNKYQLYHYPMAVTQWRNWLRDRAKSREVAGLIPVGFIGIFHRLDRSEYQEDFLGCHHYHLSAVSKYGNLSFLKTKGLVTCRRRDCYTIIRWSTEAWAIVYSQRLIADPELFHWVCNSLICMCKTGLIQTAVHVE